MSREFNLSVDTIGRMYRSFIGQEISIGIKIPEVDLIDSGHGALETVKFNSKGELVFVLRNQFGSREETFYSTKDYNVEINDTHTARFRMEGYTDKAVYIEVKLKDGGYDRALNYLKSHDLMHRNKELITADV